MGRFGLRALLGLLLLALAGVAAQAQVDWLPEIRGGLVARGIDAGGGGLMDPGSIRDANVELLFTAPDLNAWAIFGELRPHLGATVSFGGQDSKLYGGLSWTVQVPVLPVFLEASAGAVLSSALATAPSGDASRNFGCGVGLRLAGSAGLQLPAGFSLIGTLEHLPDFGSCGVANRGATNVMARIGHRF
jgi:lipid A 3-O-deacylase